MGVPSFEHTHWTMSGDHDDEGRLSPDAAGVADLPTSAEQVVEVVDEVTPAGDSPMHIKMHHELRAPTEVELMEEKIRETLGNKDD
ncbi:hypothetical protein JCM1841_004399 [Sporobolomyces salmonicolor]